MIVSDEYKKKLSNKYSKIYTAQEGKKRLKHTLQKRKFPNGQSDQLHSASERCKINPNSMLLHTFLNGQTFLIAKT